ncbi:hypothetical protein ML401_39105 (plasmid) [Bradyrhizobium sp. 62B]|nr:hypothetical protein ML401_39105 [Bradyrhizobium sp. 62B]
MAIAAIPDGEEARRLLFALSFCAPERLPISLVQQFLDDRSKVVADTALSLLLTFSLLKADIFDDGTKRLWCIGLFRQSVVQSRDKEAKPRKQIVVWSTLCIFSFHCS